MGEIHGAEDLDIGRPVAIKRLLPEATSALGLARFVEEVRVAGSLDHPNVVPIHDVGIDEQGRYFFVMKYVDGQTLESIIEKMRAGDAATLREYTIGRRVQVAIGILRALSYAHARGIVHRDVKPANVMIGRYGEVVLMDWGIAKRLEGAAALPEQRDARELPQEGRAALRSTRRGDLIGSPVYMSPEQARAEDVDARSDLFSMAVLVHELLSLRHYLESETTMSGVLARVASVNEDVRSLAAFRSPHGPRVPAELSHVLARGMRRDRAERFQSADQMIESLLRTQDGTFAIQCPVTFVKRVTREAGAVVDRSPLAAMGLLATVVLVVLLAMATLVTLVMHAVSG
jgi:serine/threonine-protein kinase